MKEHLVIIDFYGESFLVKNLTTGKTYDFPSSSFCTGGFKYFRDYEAFFKRKTDVTKISYFTISASKKIDCLITFNRDSD